MLTYCYLLANSKRLIDRVEKLPLIHIKASTLTGVFFFFFSPFNKRFSAWCGQTLLTKSRPRKKRSTWLVSHWLELQQHLHWSCSAWWSPRLQQLYKLYVKIIFFLMEISVHIAILYTTRQTPSILLACSRQTVIRRPSGNARAGQRTKWLSFTREK